MRDQLEPCRGEWLGLGEPRAGRATWHRTVRASPTQAGANAAACLEERAIRPPSSFLQHSISSRGSAGDGSPGCRGTAGAAQVGRPYWGGSQGSAARLLTSHRQRAAFAPPDPLCRQRGVRHHPPALPCARWRSAALPTCARRRVFTSMCLPPRSSTRCPPSLPPPLRSRRAGDRRRGNTLPGHGLCGGGCGLGMSFPQLVHGILLFSLFRMLLQPWTLPVKSGFFTVSPCDSLHCSDCFL